MSPKANPNRAHIAEFLDYVHQTYRWNELTPEHQAAARRHWLENFAGFVPGIDLYEVQRAAVQLRYLQAGFNECLDQAPTDFPPDHPVRAALEQLTTAAQASEAAQAVLAAHKDEIPRIGQINHRAG